MESGIENMFSSTLDIGHVVSTAKFVPRNLEFKIHFPVFLDRSNKLDMALTEYLYIKLLSVLHNDSYHVIQYTLLYTVKHFFHVL